MISILLQSGSCIFQLLHIRSTVGQIYQELSSVEHFKVPEGIGGHKEPYKGHVSEHKLEAYMFVKWYL